MKQEDLFYVVYGVMNSMNARYFDVDNYLDYSKETFEDHGASRFICIPQDLMLLFFTTMTEENGLFLWNGRQEKDMKNRV